MTTENRISAVLSGQADLAKSTQRIVFLDYLRVFACFLVILVHASENYYGAGGESDMAGPVSMLLNETDRLWGSIYDGFSRMAVPLFLGIERCLQICIRSLQRIPHYCRNSRLIPIILNLRSLHGIQQ